MAIKDLSGLKFGRWTVIKPSEKRSYFICRCSCGSMKDVRRDHLLNGKSTSCGCYVKENHSWNYKGNPDRRVLNHIYGNMINRCCNSKSDSYGNYGGRGITVDPVWMESFNTFAEWAYMNGFECGLTIDRINNDLGYCPDNCRFVSMKEQNNNKRNNVVLIIDGVRYTVTQAAEKAGINPKTVFNWLYRGYTKDKVISKLLLAWEPPKEEEDE